MKNIPGILSKALFSRASEITALSLTIIVTSCSYSGVEKFVDGYANNDLITMHSYNYADNSPVKFGLKGFEDTDFKMSTNSFYMKKRIALTSDDVVKGKEFHEAEERREAAKYLTLR